MKSNKEVIKLIFNKNSDSFLSDTLVGILKNDYDVKEIKKEKLVKYEYLEKFV